MITSGTDLQQSTTVDLISRMNRENVEYAVLRNYEEYPKFGHDIDLVVRAAHLSTWADIVRDCAIENRWNVVTKCEHWARSAFQEHAIQILKLYKESSTQFLQIDAFHSFLIFGCPLFDEETLLRGRIWDERGFYRIDEAMENVIRLLQIAKLIGKEGATEKVARYRNRLLAFIDHRHGVLLPGFKIFLPELSTPLSYLRSGNLQKVETEVSKQKLIWWIRKMLSAPFHTGKMVVARLIDYTQMVRSRPCGFMISVFANDSRQRGRLESAASELVNANMIPSFSSSKDKRVRRNVTAAGGVVLNWVSRDLAEMVISIDRSDKEIVGDLLRRIIERHPLILEQRTWLP